MDKPQPANALGQPWYSLLYWDEFTDGGHERAMVTDAKVSVSDFRSMAAGLARLGAQIHILQSPGRQKMMQADA
jgi:hypothetical protein